MNCLFVLLLSRLFNATSICRHQNLKDAFPHNWGEGSWAVMVSGFVLEFSFLFDLFEGFVCFWFVVVFVWLFCCGGWGGRIGQQWEEGGRVKWL